MTEPVAIDGAAGELVVRRIVVWRRLEPGDAPTPGAEPSAESVHVEARVVEVGIGKALRDDLVRLWRARDRAAPSELDWTHRYEPGGIFLAIGGGVAVGGWLDYLPTPAMTIGAGVALFGACVAAVTRLRKARAEASAKERWQATKERSELEAIEARLRSRWERFAGRLRKETGFRVELRVGDLHEAERLVSIDPARLSHPASWLPDGKDEEVRYGWAYADGRVVEQVAILEPETARVEGNDEREAEHEDGTDDANDDDAADSEAADSDAADSEAEDRDAEDREQDPVDASDARPREGARRRARRG